MLWYDTGANILKMRSEADDVWINIGYLDQSADAFRIFDDTQVVNTSGVQTGLIGDQANSAWEAGTSTTESLVSPAKVKAAIEALSTDAEALAEGAAGAPRILGLAAATNDEVPVLSVVSADTFSLGRAIDTVVTSLTTTSTSFSEAIRYTIRAVSGSIRLRATQSGTDQAGDIRLLKNGTVIASFSSPNNPNPVARSVDVSVQPGDVLVWEIRLAPAPGGVGSYSLSNLSETATDGYTTIPLLIPASEV
jgi:hypothetical protein